MGGALGAAVAVAAFAHCPVGAHVPGVAADTTFAVPRSNGCNGGGLVDAKLGLPSPAGANAVRLEIDVAVASASRVAAKRRRVPARRRAPRRP